VRGVYPLAMIEASVERCLGTTDPLALKLRGGHVHRYHTEPIDIRQDVAQHTWRMMTILQHIWPDASRELLVAALHHDMAEVFVGDLPAPLKRLGVSEELKIAEVQYERWLGIHPELSKIDHCRLKVADYLELLATVANCVHPRARQIANNGRDYIQLLADMLPEHEVIRVARVLEQIEQGEVY
jgi:5'-deoxynucleotidase YfbR-like HD superfamily hydrolase